MIDKKMDEPGYEKLAEVLSRAFAQAARGKGKERHAQGEPFHEQVMQEGARRFGHGALLFQAFKKSEESQRLPLDRAVAELLGAIVYTAGAVIALEQAAGAGFPTISTPPQDAVWIPWGGGIHPPVNPSSEVEVKVSGKTLRGCAGQFTWGGESALIVSAYRRVLSQQPDGL